MVSESEIYALLQGCSAATQYLGLDKFKQAAQTAPEAALHAVWTILTQSGYLDDDALCLELIETVTSTSGHQIVEKLIRNQWGGINHEARMNIIAGVGSQKAISTELALMMFHNPTTNVHQRHRIVVALFAGDPDRRVENIVALAKQIGTYTEPHRQVILENFIRSLERAYP